MRSRARWPRALEVRLQNLVRPADALRQRGRKHYDGGDYPQSLLMAREKIDFAKWRERQKRGEPDGRMHRRRFREL